MGYQEKPEPQLVREQMILDRLRSPEEHLILVIPVAKNMQLCNVMMSVHDNFFKNETVYLNEAGGAIKWLKSGEKEGGK